MNEDDDSDASDSDDDDDEDDQDENQSPKLSVELRFDLPEKYPDEKPSMQIVESYNLDEDGLSELMDELNTKADESLGTVMIFTLVSHVVEWLSSLSDRDAQKLEMEAMERQQELEAKEKAKFFGTPVNKQTFMAWRAKFDAEMLKLKIEKMKNAEPGQAPTKRLTGRELFESDKSLAESDLNFVDDLDQGQLEALLHDIEEVNLDDADIEGEHDVSLDEEDEDDEDDDDISDEEWSLGSDSDDCDDGDNKATKLDSKKKPSKSK